MIKMNTLLKGLILVMILGGLQTSSKAQIQNPSQDATANFSTYADKIRAMQNTYLDEQIKLNAFLKTNNLPRREKLANGVEREAVGMSVTGLPIYVQTFNNVNAAKTVSTSKVWPGGALGLNLSGSGMTARLGVWDGGKVLTTHQEFQGRATQIDAPSSLSDHATHVSGTMIAGGVVANAKGMSFQAPIKCHDWNSDVSEMATAAAAGLLISNHSYGQVCGWQYNSRWEFWGDPSVSTTHDYKYGFYDANSAQFDQVAIDNPNYLIFMAAGNDRGEPSQTPSVFYVRNANGGWSQGSSASRPASIGPYDCISGGAANAKNVMTVGAVNAITTGWTKASDVVMSDFSGWGPTDDGRIKPDIVANGVSVYSSISTGTAAYDTYNGTSMATPSAAGSALLIQQHHNNVKGKFMRSAALKGLIIHTADEAGTSTGPDYSFGWGLMNTAKAVQTISDTIKSKMLDYSLSNGGKYTFSFYADGSTPIRATICWTDIAATSPSPIYNSPTPMLVNDLDLRVNRVADNTIFYPYKLDKSNPSLAATTGDNTIDNVEQIFINTPVAGTYTLTITHKGTLASAQNVSLVLTGITPKPVAFFTTSSKTACAGSSVLFQDQSAGATSRTWYFPGANPSTSTLANPTVVYNSPGVYPVAMAIKSNIGFDSIYVNDYITIGGMSLPINETFELNSPSFGLWTIQNPEADSTWRLWKISGNGTSNYALGINNFDNPTNGFADRLISPILDLRGYSNASISFQHAYTRYDNSTSDTLVVAVSTNCGATWTRLLTLAEDGSGNFATAPDANYSSTSSFTPSTSADWCGGGTGATCKSMNLSAYVGKPNVKIKFEQIGNSGNNLFLDNIQISGVVNSKPIAGFFAAQQTVCTNTSVKFIDTTANQATQWAWYVNGVLFSTIKNPFLSFPAPGDYAIALSAKNANGSDSVYRANYIHVNAGPALPSISSSKGLAVCNGDSTQLTAIVSGSFIWFKDNIAQNALTTTSFYTKDPALYYVRNFDNTGCFAQSNMIALQSGNTPAKPTLTKSISTNSFCDGNSFSLFSSAASNNQWYKNDSLMPGQTNKTLTYNDSGFFKVTVNNNGCSNTSDVLHIEKLSKPSTSELTGRNWAPKGDTVQFSVTGTPGSTYTWTFTNATQITGSNTSVISAKLSATATAATINVIENGANNCIGAQKTMNVSLVNTSISKVSNANNFTIYPNPAKDFISIECNFEGKTKVEILNMLGQVVSQSVIYLHATNAQMNQVDIASLQDGIYMIRIEHEGKKLSKSFIKK